MLYSFFWVIPRRLNFICRRFGTLCHLHRSVLIYEDGTDAAESPKRKNASITYSECVSVALVIKHAKRVRRIILSPVVCLALSYFSTLSHKRYDFRGKMLLNIKRVFVFSLQLFLEIFPILRRTDGNMAKNVYLSSFKVLVIFVRF